MALFPVHYCGSIGYYQALASAHEVIFDVHEHFVKQTHRSRMEILGPNGIHKLVIPTVKTGKRRPMGNVKVSHAENWRKDHWKGLEAAYRRSPYFEFFEDHFRPLFKVQIDSLVDLNLQMHELILELIELPLSYEFTTNYTKAEELDFRSIEFSQSKITPYLQVFSDRHPFVVNLSILDSLFNVGPQETKQIILAQ